MKEEALSYFHRLSELLLSIQSTDGQGAVLSMEEGKTKAVDMILSAGCTSRGVQSAALRKMMLIGNGGSAAIVSHMQNDLCKVVGVRAMVFNEPPLLTAFANDYGYEFAFEHLVALWADPGDLLLAVSSSGQSENILRAVRASRTRQCRVITFSGFSPDNPLRQMGDLNFYVPSQIYGHVELAHSALSHLLTDSAVMARR